MEDDLDFLRPFVASLIVFSLIIDPPGLVVFGFSPAPAIASW